MHPDAERALSKVTAFITRPAEASNRQAELLLLRHPFAGIQIPAGTAEPGESPAQAVLREANEETGLQAFAPPQLLLVEEEALPDHQRAILNSTKVFSRPDPASLDWAVLRRGLLVDALRQLDGFTQVCYAEPNQVADPDYWSYVITGWVQDECLTSRRRRSFFHLPFTGKSPLTWTHFADNHYFTLFWAPLSNLPALISPQDSWLEHLQLLD